MRTTLDHVNISVVDLERTIAFLRIAFPDFRVRGGGKGEWQGGTTEWLHLGLDELYVSLNTSEALATPEPERHESRSTGLNHVGFTVGSVSELQRRYEAGGFVCQLVDERPSRRRLYVKDSDNIIWEFIEYLSEDFAVRNDYSI